jgi:hypothetical protein
LRAAQSTPSRRRLLRDFKRLQNGTVGRARRASHSVTRTNGKKKANIFRLFFSFPFGGMFGTLCCDHIQANIMFNIKSK